VPRAVRLPRPPGLPARCYHAVPRWLVAGGRFLYQGRRLADFERKGRGLQMKTPRQRRKQAIASFLGAAPFSGKAPRPDAVHVQLVRQ
jgi:hypothetical protein